MLSKAISARQDAASTFASATPPRQDLAEQYRAEASFLQEFAPAKIAGMTAEELEESVRSVLKALGLETVAGKDMGRVVKGTIELVAGKAEGKEVSEAVKRVISKL